MIAYFVKRLAVGVPTFFVASMIVFAAVSSEVGDPRDRLASCYNCDQSAYGRQVEAFRLDEPLSLQYVAWLGRLTSGKLEPSTTQADAPVLSVAASRLLNTLWLVGPAWLIGTTLVISFAASSVRRPASLLAKSYSVVGTWGLAVPAFLTGLLLQSFVILFAARWGLKPFWSQGMRTESVKDFLSSATLPWLTLLLMLISRRYSLTRSAFERAWSDPSISAARARGIPERRLLWGHALRLALGPFLAASWADVTLLIGGAVVVESVFSWPGVGRLLVASLSGGDTELSLILATASVLLVLLAGIVTDILHAVVDPRVRDRHR